jgi:membrane protein implicated in regulation of membrane protease activity
MLKPLFLFSGFIGAVVAVLVASSHGFEWALAVMGMLILLALILFFVAEWFPRWPETPLQTDARRRRQSLTILDILQDDMRGGL